MLPERLSQPTKTCNRKGSTWHPPRSSTIPATLAVGGLLMTPVPLVVVVGALVAAVAFSLVVDAAKGPVFRRLGIGD